MYVIQSTVHPVCSSGSLNKEGYRTTGGSPYPWLTPSLLTSQSRLSWLPHFTHSSFRPLFLPSTTTSSFPPFLTRSHFTLYLLLFHILPTLLHISPSLLPLAPSFFISSSSLLLYFSPSPTPSCSFLLYFSPSLLPLAPSTSLLTR
jgi:hypothetical protein